ncbi:MAG: hypothetical protein TU36_005375 [Vulcanisaeta sp. AZ3]
MVRVKQWVGLVGPTHIVVVGNHMTLSLVRGLVEEGLGGLGVPIIYFEQGEGGLAGVYEFLRVGGDVLRKLNLDLGQGYVDEVFRRLGLGSGDVAVGVEEVRRALEFGAVDTLLILDETFKELGEVVRGLAGLALRTRANLFIVPVSSEAGERLRGVGGVVALLRFSISS